MFIFVLFSVNLSYSLLIDTSDVKERNLFSCKVLISPNYATPQKSEVIPGVFNVDLQHSSPTQNATAATTTTTTTVIIIKLN
jgi:hypothetical protein